MPHDRLGPLRPHTNRRNAATRELLKSEHVLLSVEWQVRKFLALGKILVPAGQVLVNGLSVVHIRLILWHVLNAAVVDAVCHAHGNLLDAREHVKLGQDDVRQ